MDNLTRFIFRADAVFDFSFGMLMFLVPWIDGIYDLLDLPNPKPEVYTQLGGGLLVMSAYLLWVSLRNEEMAVHVGLAIGVINALGVLLIGGWLLSGELGVGTVGTIILVLAMAILAIFAVVELRYALSRR